MLQVLWDASALVKHYFIEAGSDTVDAVFAAAPAERMTLIYLGHAEVVSILRRKRNDGLLDAGAFSQARQLLQQDVLGNPDFRLLMTDEADMLNAITLIDRYNLNASDAIILTAYRRQASATGDACVVVAADGRLVKAAIAEGLHGLNPQQFKATDVSAFLAGV